MVNRKRKSTVISISCSSSEEDSDDDNGSSNSSGDECELSDRDCVDEGEDEDDGVNGDDVGDDSGGDDDDDESEDAVCDRVVGLLRDRSALHGLTLKDCKTYLRRNGLRISGTKDQCIWRIREHWRLKDGNGEALHPRPSFTINCTGDVCRGDIVLFTQKVYDKFDKMSRTRKMIGKRTIAGRVVKESYGAAKQQHTFTVEVLWCKGREKLRPLFPLLVKGRNLYKMGTFRQPWRNESERAKVLDEKHKRGMVARQESALRKERRTSSTGSKRQKVSHCSTKTSQGKNHRERKGVVGKEGASSSRSSRNYQHQKPASVKQLKPSAGVKCLKPSHRPQQNFFEYRSPRPQMVHQFQAGHYRPQFTLHSGDDFA
ncbi:Zinc finger CCCH domain-containing protein [Drosera capensis]